MRWQDGLLFSASGIRAADPGLSLTENNDYCTGGELMLCAIIAIAVGLTLAAIANLILA